MNRNQAIGTKNYWRQRNVIQIDGVTVVIKNCTLVVLVSKVEGDIHAVLEARGVQDQEHRQEVRDHGVQGHEVHDPAVHDRRVIVPIIVEDQHEVQVPGVHVPMARAQFARQGNDVDQCPLHVHVRDQ